MAESRRYGPTEPLNLDQILQEAQERWLRPMEICEILRNHEKFRLTSEPPNKPPAGSLFLFDRKVLRYFHKDGHRWRKTKDGKTINEAHEKLKAGSVDVLHCLYAHGEDNENFQRRSYWMFHEQLENIVLVHYIEVKEGRDFLLLQPHSQDNSSFPEKLPSTGKVDDPVGRANSDEAGEPKKLDSFGRLMDKEIGGDCDDSLMASDSGNYWNTFDTENEKEVSSVLDHMQLNFDSMGPSLYQDHLFSISVFAPDWAYSGVETKVLITGTFLGEKKQSGSLKWGCMFGEIEAPAEVLADNVMRCQVPFHAPGRVPLYITCSNRLACSEVREFEYREKPQETSSSITVNTSPEDEEPEDEVQFRIRLGRMLDVGSERKGLTCYVVNCQKCWFRKYITSLKTKSEIFSEMVENAIMFHEGYSVVDPGDALIENVLKSKLYDWVICRAHEGSKGPNILDNEGLGLIHLAAALGFAWAMSPLIYADVDPDFRDARGKTALHWASYYGREETVIELIRLRASAGAVDDPTSASPGGQTAADLASSRGHKGIAGYLAKEHLASHLSSLRRPANAVESVTADIVAEKAFETAAEKAFETVLSPQQTDEEHSLKVSLAAVRKSARAVALIQAAFRAPSFRPRQLTKSDNDISESSVDLVALGFLNKVQKVSHFEDYLHSAAIKVQQKYRGWKGRKEFLKIRNRVVKIQAYVRGHQVRKQYKKIVWSVSIVEKAILRWRRKGKGLRGFRKQETLPNSEKNDEYDFLRIGRKQKFAGVEKALTRVQSMVRDPKGRDQYMSLFSKFEGPRHSSYSCIWRKIRLNGKYCGPLALRLSGHRSYMREHVVFFTLS